MPRRSLLYRSDAFREKIIAANVTQIIIVLAAVPSFYEELVNRCLIAAESAEIKALIVLNKADLKAETAHAMEKLALYRDLGYPLLPLSAHQDISPLLPFLQGETSVLVGQSGMGKSSIINALFPGSQSRKREKFPLRWIRASTQPPMPGSTISTRTATSSILPACRNSVCIISSRKKLDHAFIEFRPYLGQCKFNNCRHQSEPGCAVLAAAISGTINQRRLATYQKLAGKV